MNLTYRATLLGIAVALLPESAALAQQNELEEVVVTAQRRAESLQDVPLSITAFSEEMLDTMGITDIKAITERTPGFTMGMFNPLQTQLYIRGIGSNEDGAGGDQSVILFIDEVYAGRSAGMNLDLFDLERVEVLRGPQGTLFGKNVVGGAVNLITRKPGEDAEAVLEATYGNFNAINVRGRAMGPIGENLYGKISFSSRNRDGYLTNYAKDFPQYVSDPADGDDILDVDTISGRGHLRWLPTDELEINLTASVSDLETSSQGAARHFIGPPGLFWPPDAALIADYDDKPHAVIADDRGKAAVDSWSITGRVDYQINESTTFTSLTAFRNVDGVNREAIGSRETAALRLSTGTIGLGIYGDNDSWDESDTFTQELRLSSSGAGRLQWVAGLYYLNEQTDRTESLGLGLEVPDGLGGTISVIPKFTGFDVQDNETESFAVFGQLTYAFSEQWSLSIGARQTEEEKKIHRIGLPATPAIAGFSQPLEPWDFEQDIDFSAFTPRASLEFRPTDRALLYATYSEGFKSGGWQGLSAREVIASTPFQPEEAILYELGAKTEWFDNRLRFNVATFITDYTDLQILQLLVQEDAPVGAPGILLTQNAADAEIFGIEAEFTIVPNERWLISGSLTHLDTEFSNFFIPSGFRTPGGVGADASREGNDLRNAPNIAFNVFVRYEHPLTGGATLAFQGDFRHKDKVYQDPDLEEVAAIPAYDLADFKVSYEPASEKYRIAAWVTNAFNEDYYLHNYPGTGDGFATAGPPRMYGLTVTFRPVL